MTSNEMTAFEIMHWFYNFHLNLIKPQRACDSFLIYICRNSEPVVQEPRYSFLVFGRLDIGTNTFKLDFNNCLEIRNKFLKNHLEFKL